MSIQHRISEAIIFFEPIIANIYNSRPRNDLNRPCLFFGVYKSRDLEAIQEHQGLKLIIFTGHVNKRFFDTLKQLPKTTFIACGNDFSDFFKGRNYSNYVELKLPFTKYFARSNQLTRSPNIQTGCTSSARNCIYIYTNPHDPLRYGHYIYRELKKLLPNYRFRTFANPAAYNSVNLGRFKYRFGFNLETSSELEAVFDGCFIGLCPTESSESAITTTADLGYYGLKCVHNIGNPNTIDFPVYPILYARPDESNQDKFKYNLQQVTSYLVKVINQEYEQVNRHGLYSFETQYNEMYGKAVDKLIQLAQGGVPPP